MIKLQFKIIKNNLNSKQIAKKYKREKEIKNNYISRETEVWDTNSFWIIEPKILLELLWINRSFHAEYQHASILLGRWLLSGLCLTIKLTILVNFGKRCWATSEFSQFSKFQFFWRSWENWMRSKNLKKKYYDTIELNTHLCQFMIFQFNKKRYDFESFMRIMNTNNILIRKEINLSKRFFFCDLKRLFVGKKVEI